MKIAFLSSYDPLSTKSWSGTPYYMLNALKKKNVEIEILGPVKCSFIPFLKGYKFLLRLFGINYDYSHSVVLAWFYARKFKKKLKKIPGLDFIIAPAGSTEIALLDTNIPILYLSDTTFDQLKNYYDNLIGVKKGKVSRVESLALQKSAIISFPSKWASDFCKEKYLVDNKKVFEIQWGANLNEDFPTNRFYEKDNRNYRCLFLGVDWIRKGGDTALASIARLREKKGVDARLVICGCEPIIDNKPEWVEIIGRLNKNDQEDYNKFRDLLITSDVLLLPTIAECYGMVFCEAAAYGLPVVATDTGGVSSIIINDVTGLLIEDPKDVHSFTEALFKILCDKKAYNKLSANAKERYLNVLNWDIWAQKILELMYDFKK